MLKVKTGIKETNLLQVRSLLGTTAHLRELFHSGDQTVDEIDLSHLLPGLYLVSLSRDGKPAGTRPLFIQK